MAPKGTAGTVAAVTYLGACLAVLAIAVAGRELPDTDIVVAYAMLILSFPVGYVVAVLFGAVGYALYEALGIVMPGGFGSNAVYISAFAIAGYVQWFIVVPWLYRKLRAPSNKPLEAGRGS